MQGSDAAPEAVWLLLGVAPAPQARSLTASHAWLVLCRAAASSPAFSFVLRYNQRGVGRSSGRQAPLGTHVRVLCIPLAMSSPACVLSASAARGAGRTDGSQLSLVGADWGGLQAAGPPAPFGAPLSSLSAAPPTFLQDERAWPGGHGGRA